MKFIAFILSIYILALNFAPCEDNATSDNDIKIEISQNSGASEGHNVLDLCSPFCQCHCCHIHATYFNVEEATIASKKIFTDIFMHFDGLGKDIHISILQPPQV
tara:strand:+ start:720 stop:1031 length:312 start_codon:yes stop_codon:yes gene_type:complete